MKQIVVVETPIQQVVTVACGGSSGGGAQTNVPSREPVSVFNNGSPEIVFDQYGDVVMNDAT